MNELPVSLSRAQVKSRSGFAIRATHPPGVRKSLMCASFACFGFALALSIPVVSTAQIRQDRLFIDDGTGKMTMLKSSPLSLPSQTLLFPAAVSPAFVIVSNVTSGQTISGGLTINDGMTVNGGLSINGTMNFTDPIAATSGGTGYASYHVGDILYASSTTALAKLSIGIDNKVLGVSGGAPVWIDNGATITNTVNTPATLAISPTNDYAISTGATYIRLSNSTASTLELTGVDHTGISDGRLITLTNSSTSVAQSIIIKHQSSNSGSGNRFDLPGGTDIILAPNGTATFEYDATDAAWKLISTN